MSKEFPQTHPDVLAQTDIYEMGTLGGFDLSIHPVSLGETEISSPILTDMSSPYALDRFRHSALQSSKTHQKPAL